MLSIRLFYTKFKSARLGFSGFLLAGSTWYQLNCKHISFKNLAKPIRLLESCWGWRCWVGDVLWKSGGRNHVQVFSVQKNVLNEGQKRSKLNSGCLVRVTKVSERDNRKPWQEQQHKTEQNQTNRCNDDKTREEGTWSETRGRHDETSKWKRKHKKWHKAGCQRTFMALNVRGIQSVWNIQYEAESNGAAMKRPHGKGPLKMFVQWRVIGARGRHGGIFVNSSNIKSAPWKTFCQRGKF